MDWKAGVEQNLRPFLSPHRKGLLSSLNWSVSRGWVRATRGQGWVHKAKLLRTGHWLGGFPRIQNSAEVLFSLEREAGKRSSYGWAKVLFRD